MKQDWPVISQTPLAMPFLAELIRLEYPDTGEKWASMLEQQMNPMQQMQGVINSLAQIVMSVVKEHPEILQPEDKQNLGMVLKQAQQLAGPAATHPESGEVVNA